MPRTWSAVLARIGVPTGDNRIIAPGALSSRDLPLPLLWQRQTGDGHGGAVVVSRIETVTLGDGMVTATGSMIGDYQYEVEELIEAGVIGPSVDLDDFEYVLDDQDRVVITRARIAGATLVAVPAFADVSITLDPLPASPSDVSRETPELEYSGAWTTERLAELAAFSVMATERLAPPVLPTVDWFANPQLSGPTPLTVTPEGRVLGHIATWSTCHVGMPGCVTPPASQTGYSYFLLNEQKTAEGVTVPVGKLTVGGGHASPELGFRAAAEHYDDVAACVAKVFAGEDEHGIWVAGWMVPGADPVRVEQFATSPVSGDWRRIGGSLEMIAVCAVNTPGFPVPRTLVKFSAERNGQLALTGVFGPERGRVVQGAAPAPDVSRETSTHARAAWARAQWKAKNL